MSRAGGEGRAPSVVRVRPGTLLRTRLSLLLGAALVLSLLAFAGLADALFGRLQSVEMRSLLERELARVQRLLAEQALGERFLDTRSETLVLQFVTRGGSIAIPADAGAALPLTQEPEMVEVDGRRLMVASAPWSLPSGTVLGTIRLGLDASDALASRRVLRLSMLIAGAVIALAAGLGSLGLLSRALRPLRRLAEDAGRLDPADPRLEPRPPRGDEVGAVADALDRAIRAIRERQQAERDALAEVAHELAAPLSVVAGQLEALSRRDPDPRVWVARDAAHELLYTSQDLLTLARGELGRPLQLEAVMLGDVAARVAAEYPSVELEVVGDTRVLGSPERLAQVVRNLVRNGVQASPSGRGVWVCARASGARVELSVRDDGPGMDEEARRRAFERHFTRRGGRGGSGLGLSVVRAIVEAHGGEVGVAASDGGALVRVTLPSLSAELADDG